MQLTKLWHLENFNLMKRLPKSQMMRLADTMVMKSFHKDNPIIFPDKVNQFVYFLKQGIVKIGSVTLEGNEDFKYLINSGTIFGELALMDGENPDNFAVAVEDCLICFIEVEVMKEMMNQYDSLNNEIIKLMGLRIKKVERRLESILFKDSKSRIIDFIVDFVKEFGEEIDGSIRVRNYLKHKDIAKLTNTSRQTVNSVFNDLRKKDLIEYNNRFIQIKSSDIQGITSGTLIK